MHTVLRHPGRLLLMIVASVATIHSMLVAYYAGASLLLHYRYLSGDDPLLFYYLVLPPGPIEPQVGSALPTGWPLFGLMFSNLALPAILAFVLTSEGFRIPFPRPRIVLSLIILAASVGVLLASIVDEDKSKTSVPPRALALTIPTDHSKWKGAQIWLAPTVIVNHDPGGPNRLVIGVSPLEDRRPSFTIWATGGDHKMSALFNSCSRTKERQIEHDGVIVAKGLWCEVNPQDERKSKGKTEGLGQLAPVVIELGGKHPDYSQETRAGVDGHLRQVGFSAYLGGDPDAFKKFSEEPFDELDVDTATLTYEDGILNRPALAVSGATFKDESETPFGLGAGYYVLPDERVGGFRGSVGEQQGQLLLFYTGAQANPRAWVAGWLIKNETGIQVEEILKNFSLILLGGLGSLITFTSRRPTLGATRRTSDDAVDDPDVARDQRVRGRPRGVEW